MKRNIFALLVWQLWQPPAFAGAEQNAPQPDPVAATSAAEIVTIETIASTAYLVRTDASAPNVEAIEVSQADVGGLRNVVGRALASKKSPQIILKSNDNSPFQSLFGAIDALNQLYVGEFQIATAGNRATIALPIAREKADVTRMRIRIIGENSYSVWLDAEDEQAKTVPIQVHGSKALMNAIARIKAKQGRLEISIACNDGVSVHSFVSAMAALQANAIGSYWIDTLAIHKRLTDARIEALVAAYRRVQELGKVEQDLLKKSGSTEDDTDENISQYDPQTMRITPKSDAQHDSPETKQYIKDTIARIEDCGTAHFPHTQGIKYYGSGEMSFTIDRDGKLIDQTLTRPSGLDYIDRHVARIVAASAPFGPVPVEMHRNIYTKFNFQEDFVFRASDEPIPTSTSDCKFAGP